MLSGSRSHAPCGFEDDLCKVFHSSHPWDLGPGFIPLRDSFKTLDL
ncbi:Os10g0517050 [Oryza sativa Japonica Group]|uniref:Os10g0517050 protein n=1 Tax=Oryza sativa subsp. japonica TaxID=39947 RepID=A0A0P0XW94_ORYSJ|nr:Os10g0517050 [Oryza sativa Japonica Group]